MPAKWEERARVGLFCDAGNVFSTENVSFRDEAGRLLDYSFRFSGIRQSAGLAAEILLPIGILRLSYGVPLNAETGDQSPFLRDDVERFQVAIGVEF